MIEYKVITLPLAEEDIADQTDYIAFELKSPETAINMVRGFKKVINSLSLFPPKVMNWMKMKSWQGMVSERRIIKIIRFTF